MSLRFRYRTYPVPTPLWSLNGRTDRPKPVIVVAASLCHKLLNVNRLSQEDRRWPHDLFFSAAIR